MDDPEWEMRDLSVAHAACEQVMKAICSLVARPFDPAAGSQMRRALDRVDSPPVREALGRLMAAPRPVGSSSALTAGGGRRV